MTTEPKLIIVKETPKFFHSMIGGVQTQERAKAMAARMGYSLVYYHSRLQRAYFVKETGGLAS
jgi:hypothetical protein